MKGFASSVAAIALCASALAASAQTAEPAQITAHVEEPRAFGHLVGDVVTRRIVLDVPRRLGLDERSLPQPGRVGQSFELRAVEHRRSPGLRSTQHVLLLRYQVFRAVEKPTVLDLPAFVLRFDGEPRAEELRIDFAAIGLSPLAPAEAVLREGLGTLRPDAAPLRVDTRGEQLRLATYALVASGLLVYLGYTIWGGGTPDSHFAYSPEPVIDLIWSSSESRLQSPDFWVAALLPILQAKMAAHSARKHSVLLCAYRRTDTPQHETANAIAAPAT